MQIKESIEISSKHKLELASKFNTSKVTVQAALHFYNNSDLAKQIRQAARDLLLDEAKKVTNS